MGRKILALLLLFLLLIIGVLLLNTFRAKPWPKYIVTNKALVISDSAIRHMSQAIQIPTISISDTSAIDTAAYQKFASFLEQSYPLIHQKLSKTIINTFSYIYEWKGQNGSFAPIVLMGHYDVVPVEQAVINKLSVAPFSGTITDTCIWGRGAADDKSSVIAILEGTEAMLRNGFTPQRTIYLCFGHDEEISGKGADAIVKYFEQRKIRPEMVLDEGGEITIQNATEFSRPIAVIGVAEKGYASYELLVEKAGGHSSIPAKETSIDILAAALHKLRTTESPARLTPQLSEFLDRVGSSSNKFISRLAAANMWLFEGQIKKIVEKEPEGYAMTHTTIVPTIIESGIKDNVVPTRAKAIVNSRILTGETTKSVEEYIRKVIADERVAIKLIGKMGTDPSPATSSGSPAFKRIESALSKIVPDVIPSPYQMVGATDSRFYRRISDGVVNFFPMTDAKGYHGIDERIPILDLKRGIHFVQTIISESDSVFSK
ncbi:MAG: M20/M25/M40 family metallo-hydrolase [Chitinophagaceae bacterium]